jgi:hypothetical protein
MSCAEPPAPNVSLTPAETTLAETVWAASVDLAEIARKLPGAGAAARVLDRLSEELAEAAAMVRALPGRPAGASGRDWQLLAALRTAHSEHEDVAEFTARGLARLAAELGSAEAVLANRPGSWEAGHVARLLRATVGDDDSGLPVYGPGSGGSV